MEDPNPLAALLEAQTRALLSALTDSRRDAEARRAAEGKLEKLQARFDRTSDATNRCHQRYEKTLQMLKSALAEAEAKLQNQHVRLMEEVKVLCPGIRRSLSFEQALATATTKYKSKEAEASSLLSEGEAAKREIKQLRASLARSESALEKQMADAAALRDNLLLQSARQDHVLDQRANGNKRLQKKLQTELAKTRTTLHQARAQVASLQEAALAEEETRRKSKRQLQAAYARTHKQRKKARRLCGNAEQSKMLRPTRKLKSFTNISERQQARRVAEVKRRMVAATQAILKSHQMEVENCGVIEMYIRTEASKEGKEEDDDEPTNVGNDTCFISMKRGSPYADTINRFVALNDAGVSKKKIQQVRMATPAGAVPTRAQINDAQARLNAQAAEMFDIKHDGTSFHVFPRKLLLWIIKKRKLGHVLHAKGLLELLIMGDGRGTGNSFKSVILEMRIFLEGRNMFRQDRAYNLSLLLGEEERNHMPRRLQPMLDALKKLQESGFDFPHPDAPNDPARSKHIDVKLHWTSDAKFMQVCMGTARFCDEKPNCLFCFATPEEREDPFDRCCEEKHRTDNTNFKPGQNKTDLFHFIPMSRRWIEQMHLCFRVLHDALIKQAFTDIITVESADEGAGMSYIIQEMARDGINMPKFAFRATKSKDPTAVGAWSYASLNYKTIIGVAKCFDFAGGYVKNPERGAKMQRLMRAWVHMYAAAQVFPGDGSDASTNDLWQQHSEWASELAEGNEGIPGRSNFKKSKGWSLNLVRKFYTHAWINHLPEQWERSKGLWHYFHDEDDVDASAKGGLKCFRTDSLERSNLIFFHAYFQIFSRRHKTIIYDAGMNLLRMLINPQNNDRSKLWCRHCAKGYQKRVYFDKHQADCGQSCSVLGSMAAASSAAATACADAY